MLYLLHYYLHYENFCGQIGVQGNSAVLDFAHDASAAAGQHGDLAVDCDT